MEHDELLRLAQGRTVVEAGALLGATTLKLATVAKQVVSIDIHNGYGPSTYRAYMSNLARFGDMNIITPVQADAVEMLPSVDADLVFIDLTGEFDLTQRALRAVKRGVICVHDLLRQNCQGVERAISFAGWKVAYAVDSLAVLER